MNLSKLNLNLLVALDALLNEQSVTKASKKCFITQAAMSNVLKQLRDIFQDPLLLQKGRNMVLSPRAQLLYPAVKKCLAQANTIFNPPAFDPKTSERRFILAIDEFTDFLLLPKLYKYIEQHAPNIELQIKHILPSNERMILDSNDIDLAICFLQQYENLKDITYEVLFREKMVCVATQHHPLFKNKLTLEKYLSAKHLALIPKNHYTPHLVDYILHTLGHQRKIMLRTTNIVPALYTMLNSQLIATIPEGLAKEAKRLFNASIQPCPFEIPDATFVQAWHPWTKLDSGCQWLRSVVTEIISK